MLTFYPKPHFTLGYNALMTFAGFEIFL